MRSLCLPDPLTSLCNVALTSGIVEEATAGHKAMHIPQVLLDQNSPKIFKEKLEKTNPKDPTLKKAFLEVLDKGKIPLPDRMANTMSCSTNSLNVSADNNSFVKINNGLRHMLVSAFLLSALAFAFFWPKDIIPAMAEPKLDAWLNALQSSAPFLEEVAEGMPGNDHLPVRLSMILVTAFVAAVYSICVVLSPTNAYRLELEWEDGKHSASLVFVPQKEPLRHGEGGIVESDDGADMFYYFIPSCKVTGTITIDGEQLSIASAKGWYDHEFGGKPLGDDGKKIEKVKKDGETGDDRAWNWVAIQLDDMDVQISSAVLMDTAADVELDKAALVCDGEDAVTRYTAEANGVELIGSKVWRSTRSFLAFPTEWDLIIPGVCELKLVATQPDQELLTMLVGAFWEGRLTVTGTYMGQEVTGVAFAERNGFGDMNNLKDFFTSVGLKVIETVKEILPCAAIDGPDGAGSYEQHRRLVATKKNDHLMNGLDTTAFENVVLQPIRDVIDRGGKSWRAYGALACCDAVGGDSRKYVHLICLPELMHSGSLIIDDIQDRSEMRRGKKCVHHIYGEPLSINAGCACYFLGQEMLNQVECTDDVKLRMYQIWIEALRGGHAGQGLDIHGSDHLMDYAVETGDASKVEASVHCIHRLKTAFPARCLAQMGAIYGGGSEEEVDAIGVFFEATGLAFQIIDDVLNLRGLVKPGAKMSQALKVVGEDIMEGKVTAPIAKAMALLKTKKERQAIWDIVKSKPSDQAVVDKCIAKLEKIGAIEACVEQSTEMVDAAWEKMDALLPDSFYKIVLRAFSWYLLRRHY